MKEIRGNAKNLRSLLGGAKFAIDYYQREYRWQTKQVAELVEDLAEKFSDSYDAGDDRSAVEGYGHYFLGSIIISDKDGRKFIIDGQQRLTSLTLLLIHIYRLLDDDEQKAQLSDLIFSQKFGKRSFNIDVKERIKCMDALFSNLIFEESGQPESVVNLLHRYQDIEELYPDDLADDALPYFADWLIENVHLVEITAYSDADAYIIFETMNDRGLSLTPTDMLKGYLLANIGNTERRDAANQLWRKQVTRLQELGKEEDADAIKTWLRSQYAGSIRERKQGAEPRDFDLIGTEFHRWVRDHDKELGLSSGGDFAHFIENHFTFYSRWYAFLRRASDTLTDDLETVHFCAQNNFTLQYPVLMAPICPEDGEDEIRRKLRIVSSYLDILITRRIWNWRAIDYSTMQYAMFLVMREIRGKSAPDLVSLLNKRLAAESETFAANDRFRLHGANGRLVHRLLARITDYVETCSGRPSRYHEYVQRRGVEGYEIEHIWANHPGRHADEFAHPNDFSEYRNRVGGLLLVPKNFNASYGDLPYSDKRKHYLKQNLLAQSLHEDAYERDPGFAQFVRTSALPFREHLQFRQDDLDARQDLYRQLAEQIWNPERLAQEAES